MGWMFVMIKSLLKIFGIRFSAEKGEIITDDTDPAEKREVHRVEPSKPVPPKIDEQGRQYREFRLTYYLIAEQDQSPKSSETVPILDEKGIIISLVEPSFFGNMSLQGSGKLRDGRLVNVTSKYVNVKPEFYQGVLDYHKKNLPNRSPGYSGIALGSDGRVSSALSFYVVPQEKYGKGYGIIRGVPHEPFRTLAVDMGLVKKSDPAFKADGGVIPALTKVHIKEFVGKVLPDGTIHDGWFTASDCGGGIFGAHCDVFVGTKSLKKKVSIPPVCSLWYEGIEKRIPKGYSYGLRDE